MAHNLEFNELTETHSLFTTKTAWHGLGQKVDGAQTSEEAIKLANLDFNVEKRELWTPLFSDQTSPMMGVPNKYATVRTDLNNVLGVVGKNYTVLQNKDAFKFVDDLVGSKSAIFESAGVLYNGEKVFLTCKLPEKMVVGNDVAECFFFLHNSHDGSRSVEIAFSTVFIVCENTLNMALKSAKRKQKVKHTSNILTGLFDAAGIMGITRERIQRDQEIFERMAKVNLNDDQIKKLITLAIYPEKEQINPEDYSKRFENIMEDAFEYITANSSQIIPERNGTLWGFVQGVNGLANHKKYKTESDKLNSIMFGTGFNNTNKAFELAFQVLQNDSFLN